MINRCSLELTQQLAIRTWKKNSAQPPGDEVAQPKQRNPGANRNSHKQQFRRGRCLRIPPPGQSSTTSNRYQCRRQPPWSKDATARDCGGDICRNAVELL
jgi:hypothetical protein